MSKVKIEGNASGTGTLTISAPNTNVDRSLTLPDGAGEIFVGDITSSDLPSGSVLQVVQAQLGSYVDVSTTSVTNLFSASITPSSTSSKILILASITSRVFSGFNSSAYVGMKRGSTELPCAHEHINGPDTTFASATMTYLDSPSTTSSTTYYATAWNSLSSDGYRYFSDGSGGNYRNSSIQLLEIAG